jgi:hypothetical protein
MATLPSLQTLKRRAHSRLKPLRRLNIQATINQLEAIRIGPRISADDLSEIRTIIKKALERLRYSDKYNSRLIARNRMTRWRIDNGARLAQTTQLDDLAAWLLGRRQASAYAQGKRTLAKLGREHYVRIGKLGAAARWKHKHNQEQSE